jgi:hypothetical protein
MAFLFFCQLRIHLIDAPFQLKVVFTALRAILSISTSCEKCVCDEISLAEL